MKFFPLFLVVLAVSLGSPQAFAQRTELTPEQAEARRKAEDERLRTDWAQLQRYRQANSELSPLRDGETRVVFMGDSITDAWPRRSAAFFNPGNVGRGISGQTTPQMLVRFQQDVVALRPKVVVINAGTNDIAGNTGPSTIGMITDNLKSMVQLAEAAGIKVVLASITPAYDYPWRTGMQPAPRVAAVNQWMKGYCEGHGCVYADYHSALSDEKGAMKDGLSTDGIHPNEAGYAVMEPIAMAAIQQALAH
jgi:lysophospholipase L1-like esterase